MAASRNPPPSETQSLIAEQARRFREIQVNTLESHENRIERLELWQANFKGKAAVIICLGSVVCSIIVHMLTQYFKLHQ